MIDVANRLWEYVGRTIQLIHMPVPRDRDDDAYFAPLARLGLRPETELSLGLVHYTDSNSTRKRLATPKQYANSFSVATECGFGRRSSASVADLLRIHADISG